MIPFKKKIDFAPTLLDAAGVEAASPMHGVSLLPLAGPQPVEWHLLSVFIFGAHQGSQAQQLVRQDRVVVAGNKRPNMHSRAVHVG